jgi:hypothetical protein
MTTMTEIQEFQRITRNGRVLANVRVHREQHPRRTARVIDGKAQWTYEPEQRLVFTGAASGEHSIDMEVSDLARARGHWDGYLQANQIRSAPAVGELVDFPSSSSRSGWRTGRVLKVGPRRAVIEFRYKYGRVSTKTVPHHLCRFAD